MTTSLRHISCLLIGIMVVLSTAVYAQEAKSVALAKELTQLMDAKKMTAIAAKDGAELEAYAAAMYFTGSQLLVVGAKYAPAVLLDGKLLKREYQDAYIDLNSASKPGTKVFIEDAGADGLRLDHETNKGFDSIEQGAAKRTNFDDKWRKDQQMSDEAYQKAFADAEKTYCRLLTALIAEAKKQ